MTCLKQVLLLTLVVCLSSTAYGDEHSHEYVDGEEVVVWMNTVGPYHNRQETYAYFSLPFCRGPVKEIGHHHETLGEALQGVELEFSGLEVKFKESHKRTVFCSVVLTELTLKAFTYAIRNHYWYQVYVDDLPVWGVVGELIDEEGSQSKIMLFAHKRFDIGYNGDQIVDVNLTTEKKIEITSSSVGTNITFSYEVNWKPSTVSFARRFDKYLDTSFFQHRIHWFSIFNSFMMVIFLVGLVSMIMLRTLRKDYARYSREEDLSDLERDIGDEYGWKQVHGDVFRPPYAPLLFCSLIGTGYQLTLVAFGSITLALMGHLYTQRGTLLSTAIFVYAASSPVCGYAGGALYSRLGGKQWIKQMFIGAFLFPMFISSISLGVDVVAMYYHASRAIPLTSMIVVVGICLFVILPLNMVGTIVGRNLSGQQDIPCRVSTVPRPIPDKKWFMEPWSLVLLGGILPFGSIFIEIYFIFTSFWQYKIYYVFGFMMLVFIIVLVVTVCVTIVCTYFLLNSEDYRWQWTSWGSGASIAVYMYLYSIYYYFFKTKMYGLFQTVFYFSYTAFGSIGIGIMCGTAGYIGASYFIHKIYSTVKID